MVDFIEKVRPNVLTKDEVLQDVWLHQLMDYPFVPASFTNELVSFCTTHEAARKKVLMNGENFVKDEQTIELLLEWVVDFPENKRHLVQRFLKNTSTNILLKYEESLTPYMTKAYFDVLKVYSDFEGKAEEELEPLWELFGEVLASLDISFNQSMFETAKLIQDLLIELGEYNATEVGYILRDDLKEKYFSINGILAVRAVGLMELHVHIPTLMELLKRDDEDFLLEEVCTALIRLQSDEVAQALAPSIVDEDQFIFAASILRQTKTAMAEKVLVEAYAKAEDTEMRQLIIEGLAGHFSTHTFDVIEHYLEREEEGYMVDTEELFYAFYKAMKRDHPLLATWRAEALKRNEDFEERMDAFDTKATIPVTSIKVGRNDPCICGSGKKYKKCCGK